MTPELIVEHESAVDAVFQGDWLAARKFLDRIPDTDGPKRFLIDHMAEFSDTPPANWDGAFSLASK